MARVTGTIGVLINVAIEVEVELPEPGEDGDIEVTEATIVAVGNMWSPSPQEVQEAIVNQDPEQLDDLVRKALAANGGKP